MFHFFVTETCPKSEAMSKDQEDNVNRILFDFLGPV